MSRIYLPPLDETDMPADHAADVLEALLTMVELVLAAKEDKISQDHIKAVRDRIQLIRINK